MATVLPEMTFDEIVSADASEGEALVYGALKSTLDPELFIIFSASWISPARDGSRHDGEADFLIISPTHGIQVLEVKGGRIRRDAGSGRWTSSSRL